MRVLIATDSFKGSLKSLEAADIIEKGIRRVYSAAQVEKIAIADGGMGMAAALGVKFLDKDGNHLEMGGGFLDRLQRCKGCSGSLIK